MVLWLLLQEVGMVNQVQTLDKAFCILPCDNTIGK